MSSDAQSEKKYIGLTGNPIRQRCSIMDNKLATKDTTKYSTVNILTYVLRSYTHNLKLSTVYNFNDGMS